MRQNRLPFEGDGPARTAESLLESALGVIDAARAAGAGVILPLFSGGHDSLCACFVAARHPGFAGEMHHIDTGIGAKATREFIETVCLEFGWVLRVYRSNFSYERFVRRLGFPGPGSHQWAYNHLKGRCIATMGRGRGPVGLVTGCRQQESQRRMGHVEAVKVGEASKKTGKTQRKNRIWTAPCHDWSGEDQRLFMDAYDLPRNPLKLSPLGMSGECFCGAFARPGELAMLRTYAPDVAAEIDRLTQIARECGTHCQWGMRKPAEKALRTIQTGPLCHSCDAKMAARGVLFTELEEE